MDRIINLDIPEISEQIFANFGDKELIRFLSVSKTWKVLASKVLLRRWTYPSGAFAFRVACYGEHSSASVDVVKFLLENMNETNEEMWKNKDINYQPFYWACCGGNIEIVKLLLDHPNSRGINLNVVDDSGCTPFQMACIFGKADVVQLLLESNKPIDFTIPQELMPRIIEDILKKFGKM